MYHLAPFCSQYSSLSDSLGLPRSQLGSNDSAREKYLTALAAAKAAEAEYIAAEAVQREEDALLRRLEEIQLQKRRDELLRSHPRSAVVVPPFHPVDDYSLELDRYPHFEARDRLSLLRNSVEQEEVSRAVAARKRQRELETEITRYREIEEAQAYALKRKQEEDKLKELTRLRIEEEGRLRAIRQAQQAEEMRLAKALRPHQVPRQQEDLFSQLPSVSHETRRDASAQCLSGNRKFCEQPKQEPKVVDDTTQTLANFLTLLTRSHAPTPSAASSKTQTSTEQSEKEDKSVPDKFIRFLFHPDQSKESSTASEADATAKTTSQPRPNELSPSAPTLMEQLEARLNNDQSIEIRDTIQAIISSLADSPNVTSPTRSACDPDSAPAISSSKGKEKAPAPTTPKDVPTSDDVAKSMDIVRNIEASFLALQNEFVFPSQLDFSPSPSTTTSPVSSDAESATATILKLAYTSRNHPVRYYEQALNGLLSHLDSVESFGNTDLRVKRKDVVGRVERALEELEREIEGRWRHKLAKEAKIAKDLNKGDAVQTSDAGNVPSSSADAASTESSPLQDKASLSVASATSGKHDASEPLSVDDITATAGSGSAVVKSHQAQVDDLPTQLIETPSVDSVEHERLDEEAAPVVIEQFAQAGVFSAEPAATTVHSSITDERSMESISTKSRNSESGHEGETVNDLPENPQETISSLAIPIAVPAPSYPPASYPPSNALESSSSSVGTVRPYVVDVQGEEDVDTFLMPPSSEDAHLKLAKCKDDDQDALDVGSDWSEVDA